MPRGIYKNKINRAEVAKKHGIGKWMKGKKLSESSCKKLSYRMMGNKFNLGRKLSQEEKKKISQGIKKSYDLKGRKTEINQMIRCSKEYKLWRRAVFDRDNYQCIWGGREHGDKLQADHIKPFALYPELRFAIDNGRTLCTNCHKKTETYGRPKKK